MGLGTLDMKDKGLLISKIFQGLLTDADFHIKEAKKYNALINNNHSLPVVIKSQDVLRKGRAHSRACIVTAIAGFESLCNCIEYSFHKRLLDDIIIDWIPKSQIMQSTNKPRNFDNWQLVQKIRFIPVLCDLILSHPNSYFPESNSNIDKLDEVVRVRNKIIHGGLIKIACEIDWPSREVNDRLTENYYPLTKIHKDIRALSYNEAFFFSSGIGNLCAQDLQACRVRSGRP